MSHPPVPSNVPGLHGKHILITRPAEPNALAGAEDRLSQMLVAWGAQVSWLPLVEIQPVPFEWASQAAFDWLFFTSKNGVHQFFRQFDQSQLLQSKKIAVVGPATGQCVQQYGYQPDFVSPQYHAESAATAFCAAYPCAGLRVLWPCGNLANPVLPEVLKLAGAHVTPLVVYQTLLKSKLSAAEQALLQAPVDLLVFTSPSAIEAWQALGAQPGVDLQKVPVASLGPKTTKAALKHLGHVEVQANPHTLEALAQSIFNYFTEGNPA